MLLLAVKIINQSGWADLEWNSLNMEGYSISKNPHKMTIADLKEQNLIVFECTSGSHAYGLNIATSDVDIKGVFILPKEQFFGLDYIAQVADETNDTVYYELQKFVELIGKNNPTALELLNTPEQFIRYCHPVFEQLSPTEFLSKKCRDTFAGYAQSQIKKARGLNKKIVNPVSKDRKTILEFCYVLAEQGSMPLTKWLAQHDLVQEHCGLANIPHMEGVFSLFYDTNGDFDYKGIMRKTTANEVLLSSIPKGEKPLTHLHFNQNGYTIYCKNYRLYWDWVAKRNTARYENTLEHGKNYDSKNMMHTFRLLCMAEEILSEGKIVLYRDNREELLAIRKGIFSYEDLMDKAEEKIKQIEKVYQKSTLTEVPDLERLNEVLFHIRNDWYASRNKNF